MMKKIILPVFILLSIVLAACGSSASGSSDDGTVEIAILDSDVYSSLLKHIQANLKEEGIDLEFVYMSDWNMFNQALANKEIDLNFFQHKQFLKNANETNGWNLVPIAETFNFALGYFSTKHKSLEEIPDGATITVPSDPVNNGRSLQILHDAGLIKLKEGVGFNGSQADIIENKKDFKIVEVDYNMLPQTLEDSDLTYIAGTLAPRAGVTQEDALITGGPLDEFTMVLAAREDNKDNEIIKRIAEEFESTETQKLLMEEFPNEIIWP